MGMGDHIGIKNPDLLDEEESKKELQLMLECYCGIPSKEDVQELNELQRTKVKRFFEKYGWGYGVNINLNKYKPEPVFKVQREGKACCDALIPPDVDEEKLRELKEAIEFWNENSLNEMGRRALDRIFKLLDELEAVTLDWY